jgi:hypothetical protein
MKSKPTLLLLAIAGVTPLLPGSLSAAGYTKAEFTRLFKDVKVLKENVAPKDATVGGEIDPVTSVATGEGSRAELKFPDNSLTRLGANSRFTLRGDQRTLDLNEGVLLLQVPKKIGGAKVRTAAVTAAVTGTTCLFEYLPGGFIKLIVIEGSVDLIDNSNPSNFRSVNAGQMIVMKAEDIKAGNTKKAKIQFPEPVDVDLKLLLSTSNLISGNDSGMPNFMQVAQAVEDQQKEIKKGKLVATSFVLPGRGTLVGLTNDTRLNLFKNVQVKDTGPPPTTPNNPPPGNNNTPPPGTTPTPFQGFQPLISGTTVLNNNSLIQTNPHVTAYNSGPNSTITSEGVIYDATVESPFTYFGFGRTLPVENTAFQPYLESKGDGKWAAFKFGSLLINGTPYFEYPSITTLSFGYGSSGVRNVILAAEGDIRLARDNSFGPGNDAVSYEHSLNLWYSGLKSLVLFSNQGNIELEKWFAIYGGWVDLSLVAAGSTSDVNLLGEVAIWGDLLVSAGQDVKIEHDVAAKNINIASGRDVNIKGKTSSGYGYGYGHGNKKITAKENLTISAKRHINITNSSELKVLSNWWDHDALLRLESIGGDISVIQSTLEARNIEIEAMQGNITLDRSYINAGDVLKISALGPNGELRIGNSYLNGDQVVRLFAEGANGRVYFVDNSTIQGKYISIAGATVEIATGKVVTLKPGYNKIPNVYTDNPKFNDVGNAYGKFKRGYNTTTPVTVKPFAQRNGPP